MASASVNDATFFTSLNATEMAHRDATTAGFWNNELKLYSHFPKSLPAHVEKEMTKVNDDKPKAWVTMAMERFEHIYKQEAIAKAGNKHYSNLTAPKCAFQMDPLGEEELPNHELYYVRRTATALSETLTELGIATLAAQLHVYKRLVGTIHILAEGKPLTALQRAITEHNKDVPSNAELFARGTRFNWLLAEPILTKHCRPLDIADALLYMRKEANMRTDGESIDDWYNRLDTRRTEHSRIPGIYLYYCTNYEPDGETDVDQDPMERTWAHRTVIPDYTYLNAFLRGLSPLERRVLTESRAYKDWGVEINEGVTDPNDFLEPKIHDMGWKELRTVLDNMDEEIRNLPDFKRKTAKDMLAFQLFSPEDTPPNVERELLELRRSAHVLTEKHRQLKQMYNKLLGKQGGHKNLSWHAEKPTPPTPTTNTTDSQTPKVAEGYTLHQGYKRMHKYEKHSWGEPGGENYNGPCNRCSQGFGFAVYHRTRTDCNKDQSAVDAVSKDTGLRPQNRGRKPQNKPPTREREAPQEKRKYPGECIHCKTVGARRTFHIYVNPDDCIHNSKHPFQLKMNGGPQASPSLILGNAKTYFQEGHYKRGLEGQAAASFQQTNTVTNIGADAWMPPSPPGSEPRLMPPSPPPTSEEEQNETEHPPRWFTKTKQRENDSNTRRHKRRTHTSVREQPRHSMRRESRRRSSRSDKPKRKRTKPRRSRRTHRRHRRRSTTDDSYDSDTSGDSYSSSE